jgi:hypothetical protein
VIVARLAGPSPQPSPTVRGSQFGLIAQTKASSERTPGCAVPGWGATIGVTLYDL